MPMSESSEQADIGTPSGAPLAFAFSGSGGEYFRIWIVNLLLTIATLGVYSAWAKTRRLQYFYRNTRLAGASFDFRGKPQAILRGRILAILLLGIVFAALGTSIEDGILAGALALAAVPWIMRSALRFRLSNTWYRGLPFGFDGTPGKAYLIYLLPLGVFFFSDIVDELAPESLLSTALFLAYFGWPWMHGAMRRYQHRHLVYGDQRAGFPLSLNALARPYVRIVAVAVLGLVALMVLLLVMAWAGVFAPGSTAEDRIIHGSVMMCGCLFVMLGLPFTAVRMTNLAWSATAFPGVRIACAIPPAGYLRLQTVNWMLTLLTLGLFRPFAAVRTWRYRLSHMHVHAAGGVGLTARYAAPANRAATGDGLADIAGIDLSW